MKNNEIAYLRNKIVFIGAWKSTGFYLNLISRKLSKTDEIILSARGFNILKMIDIADTITTRGAMRYKDRETKEYVMKKIQHRSVRLPRTIAKDVTRRLKTDLLHITIGVPKNGEVYNITIPNELVDVKSLTKKAK